MTSDDADKDRGGAERAHSSLLGALLRRTGRVAGGTLDLALDAAALSAMFGESWLRNALSAGASPERLEAMAEAGHFLRDARETAGLSISELSERLGLRDASVLEGVERGETLLPLELMLRSASLLARHDPIPFLIKFMRSYNPQLEARLENWGVMALPRNYERERRFLNLYRQHDFLRELSDDEHARFIDYMDASTRLVVEVMNRERAAGEALRSTARRAPKRKRAPSPAAKARSAGSAATRTRAGNTTQAKAKVRKVRPKSPGHRTEDK